MKVLFIKPPNVGFYHEIERYYPVGIAYLASACRNAGYETDIFDSLLYTEDNHVLSWHGISKGQQVKINSHPRWKHMIHWGATWDRIQKKLLSYKPDIICISILHTPMYDTAYELAERAKAALPEAYIIMGGPHASVAGAHALEWGKADYVLKGECEKTVVDLLHALRNGKTEPFNIPGIMFKTYSLDNTSRKMENGFMFYENSEQSWICDLDSLIFPAADLLEVHKYEAVTIISSRGCPNRCSFCTVHPTMGYSFRARSPENVWGEIEWYIKKWGVNHFNFEDDNFLLDLARAEKILDLIIESGHELKIGFPNGLTTININKNIVTKMCKAGFTESFLGLETISSERLKALKKSFTSVEKVEEIQSWFKNCGKEIGASLIIGFPDQTIDDMIDDIAELIRRGIKFGTANPCYPIPGSALFEECLQLELVDKTTDYTWYDEFNFPLETNHFSRKQIYEVWICSVVYDYYGKLFPYLFDEKLSLYLFMQYFEKYGYGRFEQDHSGLICVPREKEMFSLNMRLTPGAKNASAYVDTIIADVLQAAVYIFTGETFKVWQDRSYLVPGYAFNSFRFVKNANIDIAIPQKFVQAIAGLTTTTEAVKYDV